MFDTFQWLIWLWHCENSNQNWSHVWLTNDEVMSYNKNSLYIAADRVPQCPIFTLSMPEVTNLFFYCLSLFREVNKGKKKKKHTGIFLGYFFFIWWAKCNATFQHENTFQHTASSGQHINTAADQGHLWWSSLGRVGSGMGVLSATCSGSLQTGRFQWGEFSLLNIWWTSEGI